MSEPRLREIGAGETALAFEAMRVLRTHHPDEHAFVGRVDQVQRPEGYRIVGVFEGERCVAVAGFRTGHNLAWGDFMYVDDLSTLPDARGRGHGAALLEWCQVEARRLGCAEFHLDSGVQADREDAHRLYFNQRMRISSYHFQKPL